MEKMFENAVRGKYRFPFKGSIGVEDLWDLSVQSLDTIFKTLNSEVKQTKEESLLEEKSAATTVIDEKISIVKYIVATKLTEAKSKEQEQIKKEQKQKLLKIIAEKEDSNLQSKSIEELTAMLNNM